VSCRAKGVRRVVIYGGARNDSLRIRGRTGSLLDGGTGNDVLRGGSGADVLRGGPGRDRLISSGDAVRDRADCGAGRDVLIADPGDRPVRAGRAACEVRR